MSRERERGNRRRRHFLPTFARLANFDDASARWNPAVFCRALYDECKVDSEEVASNAIVAEIRREVEGGNFCIGCMGYFGV